MPNPWLQRPRKRAPLTQAFGGQLPKRQGMNDVPRGLEAGSGAFPYDILLTVEHMADTLEEVIETARENTEERVTSKYRTEPGDFLRALKVEARREAYETLDDLSTRLRYSLGLAIHSVVESRFRRVCESHAARTGSPFPASAERWGFSRLVEYAERQLRLVLPEAELQEMRVLSRVRNVIIHEGDGTGGVNWPPLPKTAPTYYAKPILGGSPSSGRLLAGPLYVHEASSIRWDG